VAEDDDGHVDGTEDGQLMRLLEQAAFSLQEGTTQRQCGFASGVRAAVDSLHGAVAVVLDGLDLDLPAAHGDGLLRRPSALGVDGSERLSRNKRRWY
jgi:hypothetical protein